jgi:hypothetical protein
MGWTRYIELTMPLHVIERELRIYNAKQQKEIWPDKATWPLKRKSIKRNFKHKDLQNLIIKFKRRERWSIFKAEHSAYIDYVRKCATIPETPVAMRIVA